MQLPRFFGRRKKSSLLIVRRVTGDSMFPTLRGGQLVVACGLLANRVGDVVVIRHDSLDKVKRIERLRGDGRVFVVGDNSAHSTDSRMFGWLASEQIVGRVIWPRLPRQMAIPSKPIEFR